MSQTEFSCLVPKAQPTGVMIPVLSPYDSQPIAEVESADNAVVNLALDNAYACYKDKKSWIPMPQRIHILEKLIILMTEKQDFLAMEAAREGGKPLTDSKVEVTRAIDGIKLCIETLRTDQGQVVPMNYNAASSHRIAFTRKEPTGVVVAISAFNHPLNLIIHQVAAAVAVGCPVIVKPASTTPLSCLRFVQLFHEAGLPEAWCQAFAAKDNHLAEKLCTDPRVAFLTFIGSAKVGWSLRSKLAPGTRYALEHGGLAPVILGEDININDAIPLLIKGGFYHAGQVCVSVQRIFVPDPILSEFADEFANAAQQLLVGDPTKAETEVGPLIQHREVERVDQWINGALEGGAELLCGGQKISDSCYAATVLLDPKPTAKVSTHEIFGPVVCLYSYSDIDDAIAQANDTDFSFQGAVFTNNIETALKVYRNLDASAIMLNDHTAFRVDGMPFAGLKHSGFGVGGIPHSMNDMQVEKMLVLRSDQL